MPRETLIWYSSTVYSPQLFLLPMSRVINLLVKTDEHTCNLHYAVILFPPALNDLANP